MWGCKPSCSPIRATRGKKGASTRVSQKTLRSSGGDDQVTGNASLCCCITFTDGGLNPCLTGFCTLAGELPTYRSNLQFPVSRYLKQKTTILRVRILRTNMTTCVLDVAQFVGLLAARRSGGWGDPALLNLLDQLQRLLGPSHWEALVCIASPVVESTHLSLPT
jgi:hypothetical protein